MNKNYNKTKLACYIGFVTQAIASNFAPLLYLKFHFDYRIPLGKIALISTVYYLTQLLIDIFSAVFVDRLGYRRSVMISSFFSCIGLLNLAVLPGILSDPFTGIMISVILYAAGSALVEVLVSPIIEACPFDNKESAMSLLHSFYCWGSVAAILVSTGFFALFGLNSWKILTVLFSLIPAWNIYNFSVCPIEHLNSNGGGMGIISLFKTPLFWTAVILMICAGASELSMAQWASAYAEEALCLNKTLGDILGPCLFAFSMGISRTIYGKYGESLEIMKFMFMSGVLCVLSYIMASFLKNPFIGLMGCILCGFSVGIMWPGTISISSRHLPSGATAMFALLAMAGDLGGSLGPGIVGFVTEISGDNLRAGMRTALVFPVVLILFLFLFFKQCGRREIYENGTHYNACKGS